MVVDVGAHCSVSECQQIDFLPFTCDCCELVFCLEHRSYRSHQCPLSGTKDHRIIHCPLCRQALRINDSVDANEIFEQHARTNCNPDLYEARKPKKKERCGAKGCKEILLASNKFHCKDCRLDICLRHRFPADHKCQGRNAQMASARNRKAEKPANKPKKPAAIGSQDNQCPICSKKFQYVSQLIAHVDRAHDESSESRHRADSHPDSTDPELCPQCGAAFSSAIRLVEHVERVHNVASDRSTSRDGCVLM